MKQEVIIKIDFLSNDKNFKKQTEYFTSYSDAINWGRENISNFNIDMIKYI